MGALAASIEDIFYGRVLAGLAATVIMFELVVLMMAIRRRQRGRAPLSPRLHAIACLVIAVLPVALGISVHAARKLMFGVYLADSADPSEKAMALSRGIAGQMNAIPFGVSAILLALLLWLVGTAYTLSRPRSDGRAGSLPPVLLVVLGLLPATAGALQWNTRMIKTFASLAGLPPEQKAAIIDRQLDVARLQFALYAKISMGGILFLAVTAAALILARGRSGAGADAIARPRSARLPVVLSAAAIALSALLVFAARPLAAENSLPWPPTTGSQLVWPGGPPTPKLVGPDAPDRAPVVTVFRDKLLLDAFVMSDFEDLEAKLGTLRNNFKLLHPSEDFNEMALIEADAATPIARLTSVLRAVRGARYYHPMFAFTTQEAHVRPVLGRLERVVVTGARFRLGFTDDEEDDAEWKSAVPLRPEDFADHGAFARRLVELRRAGKSVLVKVARSSR